MTRGSRAAAFDNQSSGVGNLPTILWHSATSNKTPVWLLTIGVERPQRLRREIGQLFRRQQRTRASSACFIDSNFSLLATPVWNRKVDSRQVWDEQRGAGTR